jgi:hypothetical protein
LDLFRPKPSGSNAFDGLEGHGYDSRWFLETLMMSGLFSVVKAVQLLGGLCLVTNRSVPAGIACLMPISAVVT